MTCPTCGPDVIAAASAGSVSVCGTCGATVLAFLNDDSQPQVRHAMFADLELLDPGDIQRLRVARAKVVPHRRKAS